ncbi:Holliday junction resolvase RecU [Pseudobacillus badius]|uniref:Holliday junction resolvase RecU n=1 Tax=Bacillus badius TaxID=1455 RepID=UPI0007B38412|nr:Holliday junction resolvase RecU [Bacillus badius]KZR58339.1 Holliday junction resolvase RecU [Bacillus badius]GLY09575.1 Holliday junction resolvase RecU [Bacillus badius]
MVNYANRGKPLQNIINLTNQIYKLKGWAVVNEVPTPWRVIRRGKQIIGASPAEKSTVDYYGITHGRALAFDAKSTRETTRFPLDNVHDHQVEYLTKFQDQGGIAFFIVEFARLNKTYFVPLKFFETYWTAAKNGGRKSIPFEEIDLQCDLIRPERGVALDYLKYCS